MTGNRTLLAWHLRLTRGHLVAAAVAWTWVLFARTPFYDRSYGFLPFFFAFCHSLAIVGPLGQTRSGAFACLYTRGFSRDALWRVRMQTTLLAVLAVWGPAALLVWTGARSAVQDHLLRNPLFPLVAPRETWAPFAWLAAYGLFLPALHYAWIRRAQPTREGQSGDWLAAALAIATCIVWNGPDMALWSTVWFRAALWVAGAAVSATFLLAGRRLHRQMEVLP
jgi:hypothetical protein